RTPCLLLPLVVVAGFASGARAVTIDYFVPSMATPTIQSAVDEAAKPMNTAALSRIFLIQSPVHTTEVLIGPPFTNARRILIRPDAVLARATVVGDAVTQDIFHFTSGGQNGGATLQDLDIVREVTNNHHLIELDYGFTDLLVERCRIGSTDSSPSGTTG